MISNHIQNILTKVKTPLDDPRFLFDIFSATAKEFYVDPKNDEEIVKRILDEEYVKLSVHLDHSDIQESCSVRNVLRSRRLATFLIDEKGELKTDLLPIAITHLKARLYSLGPKRQYDAKRQEHLLNVLQLLTQNKEILRLLKKNSKPYMNRQADELIRDTLHLPYNTQVTDAHTRRAVLAAWFCCLRQNIGSCFATGPAIMIHDEQPAQFLLDIDELLSTGRLKKTFGGNEYTVPLSPSWGNGDLKKPIVIFRLPTSIEPKIWQSPGLIHAFESVGIIQKELEFHIKVNELQKILTPFILQKTAFSTYALLTAEELIRQILLQSSELSEKQIEEFENSSHPLMQGLVMTPVPTRDYSKKESLNERCSRFLQRYEIACKAFKGLADNALLKSWEFTVASFAETKLEFTKWNLYSSLGLGSSDPGGIGECIYLLIQDKLTRANKKIEELQYDYEMAYNQLKTMESRLNQASSEKEIEWRKMEYQSYKSEFYMAEEMRDRAQNSAKKWVDLHQSLHNIYLELFKDYFQEVYDADMQELVGGPFNDSPAGFRLLYKHGRSQSSQWTRVKNQHEFIEVLSSFFSSTETRVATMLDIEGIDRDLSDIVTAIITHIRTKEFLESAFSRMAAVHQTPIIKDPLEHLDKIKTKPWVYVSGGSMNTLITCYYGLEQKPKEAERWVESEVELLVFLIDTLKEIPIRLMKPYLDQTRNLMLMQSPTHAFLLKPNSTLFKEACMKEGFTYTSIRDQFINPAQEIIERSFLNEEMLRFLVQKISDTVPENFRARFQDLFRGIQGPLNPIFFRSYLLETIAQDKGLGRQQNRILKDDELDHFLYATLPLCPIEELKNRIHQILLQLPGLERSQMEQLIGMSEQLSLSRENRFIGSNQLQDICLALLCLGKSATSTAEDYQLLISQVAKKLGYAMPAPLLFSDTNWVKDEFAFLVSPGTGKLELWRIDYTGRVGYPMSIWKQWVDGSNENPKWGVYTQPFEYGQV